MTDNTTDQGITFGHYELEAGKLYRRARAK